MNNQVSTRDNERNIPVHNQQGDFHNLITHFWNMLDFSHHSDTANLEPKIEVSENKNNVTVTAEMPGVPEENINVEISSDGYLTISGEKKHLTEENHEGSYFSEISYGMVRRSIPLPWDLDFKNADADYEDGVLQIMIPKSPTEQTRRKKVSVSNGRRNKNKKRDN